MNQLASTSIESDGELQVSAGKEICGWVGKGNWNCKPDSSQTYKTLLRPTVNE